jgi:hypothetical protein
MSSRSKCRAADYVRVMTWPIVEGISLLSLAHCTWQKSIELDLKTQEGVAVFKELAKDADIVIEAMKPGTLDRLGLSYEELKKVNPKIVSVVCPVMACQALTKICLHMVWRTIPGRLCGARAGRRWHGVFACTSFDWYACGVLYSAHLLRLLQWCEHVKQAKAHCLNWSVRRRCLYGLVSHRELQGLSAPTIGK